MISNEFSWSHSRRRMFDTCHRAYFYAYYGSWGGWRRDASKLQREAYRLKKLESRWSWAGKIAHAAIVHAVAGLRRGRPPGKDTQRWLTWALEVFRSEWVASRDGKRDDKNSRGFWGLLEHEYSERVPREEWSALWERIRAGLEWLLGHEDPEKPGGEWMRTVAALAHQQLLSVDDGSVEGGAFAFEGLRVWARPDLAYLDGCGVPTAVDWKTGKPKSEHADQLGVYALFLQQRHGLEAPEVVGARVYLQLREVQTSAIRGADLEVVRQQIRDSAARMQELLSDPAGNVPRPMEAFEMTQDLEECRRCCFRRLCGRE